MNKRSLDRRSFCELAGLTLAVAALPGCGADPSPAVCGTGKVSVGPSSAIAMGAAIQVDRLGLDSLFVCRDAGGVYALDAQCTHLRCMLSLVSQAQGFSCGCHAATFDYNGQNPTGPAPTPLKHFAVCSDGMGGLVVDPDQEVEASVRFKG
jgi:Rieske Fe-S protein